MNVLPVNNQALGDSTAVELPVAPEHLPPAESPLSMTAQQFDMNFMDEEAPAWQRSKYTTAWRTLAFLPALLMTAGFAYTFYDFFKAEGVDVLEISIMCLTSFAFVWIAIAVGFSIAGLFALLVNHQEKDKSSNSVKPLNVALLAPIYNEDVPSVFGNALAALEELAHSDTSHSYSLYILSDSADTGIRDLESRTFEYIRNNSQHAHRVFYRHRPLNRGRKAGNIADWCRRWGASHDAFLVLDADSQMEANCIDQLADEVSKDPALALAQSTPRILDGKSLFARAQQFATATYGKVLATGIARVYGNQSNYWGHNAMIRTRAFARCAGLPDLPGRAPLGGSIMSHDFVEAALLCRAGWKVRLFADKRGSFEGTPQTLIDYCIRDRRWCQGNLQHLRILAAKQLRPISRFQLFQGAMVYFAPLAWLLLLIVWAAMGYYAANAELTYFREANPMMPFWPGTPSIEATTYLAVIYGMLLLPKLIGAGVTAALGKRDMLGGPGAFLTSIAIEIILSVILAPILMVQQSKAVVSTFLGLDAGWKPQNREGNSLPFRQIVRFHVVESALGAGLAVGTGLGIVSLWLLPIMVSLLFAPVISHLCSVPFENNGRMKSLLATSENYIDPRISKVASVHRTVLAELKA